MKIYTRTGDKGKTALIGGTKVPKSHLRIESYGTIDELNSFIGLLNDHIGAHIASTPSTPSDASPSSLNVSPSSVDDSPSLVNDSTHIDNSSHTASPNPTPLSPFTLNGIPALLKEIQDRLFTVGSSLACDPEKETRMSIPDLKEQDITALEKQIDRMNEDLPPMKSFILPGGHVIVSTAHVVRCVCRRAERSCVAMQEEGLSIDPLVLQYVNRLSDWLFVLSRWLGHRLQVAEIPWKPRI